MTTGGPASRCRLTAIMPVYNEAACVRDAVADVQEHILKRVPGAELIVVDDGSTDGGGAILDALAFADPAILVLHKKNGGHGDALLAGLDRARGDYIFLLDSDRQIPLSDFEALWNARADDALVCGVRKSRRDPFHRLVLSRLVRWGIALLFGRRLRDANVPFKVFARDFWLRARPHVPPNTLAPSLFLAVLAARSPGMRLVEIPVRHGRRASGKTVLHPLRLLRFCARALGQLLALRQRIGGGRHL